MLLGGLILIRCILITGSPGVGKTTIAKALSHELRIPWLNVAQVVSSHNLGIYDPESDTYDVDVNVLRSTLIRTIKEDVIVDSVIPDILPKSMVKLVIVLRLDPIEMAKRLIKRGWKLRKILENVEAELLSVITYEAVRYYGTNKVVEVNTTGKDVKTIVREILDILKGRRRDEYKPFSIDWLRRYRDPLDVSRKVLKMLKEPQLRADQEHS
ncbi:MAG: hypothetical protein DRZ82_04335 [Thermoprotei archaeon]|nr:MAG: hypothetical protein DRZ82_04335 [Thermoprotei archaeon]